MKNLLQLSVCTCNSCEQHYIVGKPFCEFKVYTQWLPDRVDKLIVSESPPPGPKKDFLYNLHSKDRLRKFLSKIFNVDEKDVLSFLKCRNMFWSMAVKCRPVSRRVIPRLCKRCVEILVQEIDLLKPRTLILLGNVARDLWNVAKNHVKHMPSQIRYMYHPLYIVRFRQDLLGRLVDILLK